MATKVKKRKARNEVAPTVNIMEPIDITKLGTSEDPCFGKLFEPTNEQCKICGDCEICSIIMGQKLHLQRAQIEKESRFKDIEEPAILRDPTTIIFERLKLAQGKFVLIENLKKELNRKGISKKEIGRLEVNGFFKRLVKHEDLQLSKDKLKLKLV